MAERKRPLTKDEAPDTARSYERAKPEAESGMGRLDADESTPAPCRDKMIDAATNRQGVRQINVEELRDREQRTSASAKSTHPPRSQSTKSPRRNA